MNLIIGDSHILALQNYVTHKNNLFHYSASSIRGLMHKKSKTGAGITYLNLRCYKHRITTIINKFFVWITYHK